LNPKQDFCGICGQNLDSNLEIEECPKCHSSLHEDAKIIFYLCF
jgi:hypothetical protein